MASSLFATRLLRLRNRRALAGARLARLGALTLLLSYLIIAVAAYNTAPLPTSLGLRIGNCGDVPCVAWVMPAGQAWQQGVRPGMMVLSIDGRTVMDSEAREVPSSAARKAELVGGAGGVLRVGLHDEPVMEGLARFSLWFLGGMFALLGAAVLLRRPDLSSARWFGAFSAAAAMALAVGPASAGSQPLWALVVQIVMLAGVGATCLPFIVALVASQRKSRLFGIPSLLIVVGIVILAGYAASVLFRPALYELVRPALFLYMAITMVGAIGLLALASVRQQSQIRVQQARIALFGIGLGTLPLITLTLVPEAFVEELLVPAHVSVLAVGLIPVAFAYAILQHNLLGIRRLVHRGMVYGLTTLATFAGIAAALSAATSLLPETVDNRVPLALTALLLTAGVALFMPLRHVVRWLVDKLLYDDVVQYEAFAEVVRGNLVVQRFCIDG